LPCYFNTSGREIKCVYPLPWGEEKIDQEEVMKKAVLMVLVVMLIVAGALVSCQKEAAVEMKPAVETVKEAMTAGAPVKIGVTVPTADHGWTGGVVWWTEKAIADWEAKDPNVEFVFKTAASAADMAAVVEDMMVQEIDALVILPHDSSVTPVVKEAYDAGIFVVVIDRGLTEKAQDVYLAGDNPGLGRVSAEWLVEAMGYKGNLVAMEGMPVPINTERVEAFEAVVAQYPDIKLLESQPAHWSTQKGLELMENYLQKYPKIDAVFCQDDDVLKGALQAYEESGRDDVKIFMGGAGSKDIVKIIMDESDPRILADVTYHPNMAASAVSVGVHGARGESLPGFYQNTPPAFIQLAAELITKENA
jgi:ribose transport system substrate-binding protein